MLLIHWPPDPVSFFVAVENKSQTCFMQLLQPVDDSSLALCGDVFGYEGVVLLLDREGVLVRWHQLVAAQSQAYGGFLREDPIS